MQANAYERERERLPDFYFLHILVGDGIQHCIVFQVEDLVYTGQKAGRKERINQGVSLW